MIIEGPVLAIGRANIDTDQIIPAHRLTGIDKRGLAEHLFSGLPSGRELLAANPSATILVTGENFGCGSSREHAVWALQDRGFQAAIAPSFARIFHENAYNSGFAPIVVATEHIGLLLGARHIAIDVAAETILADGTERVAFQLDPLRKRFLLEGGFLAFLNGKVDNVRTWLARSEARGIAALR
jgi:3-isopropylmalate/(R)-2-methylmalate dehydratase small subunit